MTTRDLIGRAKGILMERFGITDDQAFDLLVRSSQDTNINLHDVAGWLNAGFSHHGPGAGNTLSP